MRSVMLLLALSTAASAQLSAVQPGARIKLDAAGLPKHSTAVLLETIRDSVVVQIRRESEGAVPARIDSMSIALPLVRKLEVSRGRSRMLGAKRGMQLGFLTGFGIGFLAGGTGGAEGGGPAGPAAGAFIGVICAMPGAAAGALIGAERWERVYPP